MTTATRAAAPPPPNLEEGIFSKIMIEKRLTLSILEMTENMEKNITNYIRKKFTGKCIEEGYIHPGSIELKNYSAGKIGPHGINVCVLFTCLVCNPPAGMIVSCTITELTKAGVHAVCSETYESDIIKPVTVYILRDHEFMSPMFDKVKKGDVIRARILGTRFELNDPCINAVAEFVE